MTPLPTRAPDEDQPAEVIDGSEVTSARRAPPALRAWNDLGVLAAADVHVARRLGALGRDQDPAVLLGVALTVRALRLGHVCLDLSSIAQTATADVEPEVDLTGLPWPEPEGWRSRLAASPLVAVDESDRPDRPLRLLGSRLYLDRYWRQERQVAADLAAHASRGPEVDLEILGRGLDRLWPAEVASPDDQRQAASVAVTSGLAVVAGGPGTGKTTTVARILVLLAEQAAAAQRPAPRVALGAPTGRAAARLEEAVHEEARRLPVSAEARAWLHELQAATLHRLLGRRPDSDSRFRHDRRRRLPHDVVIVDETSMVSLSLMASLLEAVRPDAQLILVGDPEQLASVEAGAVLGDIVGPATGPAGPKMPGERRTIGDGIVVLGRSHRFGGTISELAHAIQAGSADQALALLRSGRPELELYETDRADVDLSRVRQAVVGNFLAVREAAERGDGGAALHQLGALRVLCAHRHGPAGVGVWTERIEAWLRASCPRSAPTGPWYPGRPVLVNANDYELQVFNGDTGVLGVGPDGRMAVAFEQRGTLTWINPARLPPAETVYATTVHKGQGSQFDRVVVVLPEAGSPMLTRQLVYTAVTRAREGVTLVGSEPALRAAIERPIARASGLRDRLWGPDGGQPEK